MHVRGFLIGFVAALCAACASNHNQVIRGEDCAVMGDEDGNGLADCEDPACANVRACAAVCGDGVRGPAEACDDGNTVDGDGCNHDCSLAACGDAILDPGEACDDGNTVDGDGCNHDCSLAACGNAILDPAEACDDGNTVDGDGCDRNCTATACGNGVPTEGEACDDGNDRNGDGCESTCARSELTYIKPEDPHEAAYFGEHIALSADGSTLAVSSQRDFAVYVYAREGAAWRTQAVLRPGVSDLSNGFGTDIALSGDGSTLAIGVPYADSADTDIPGAPPRPLSDYAGAVYVFTRSGGDWAKQAYLKAAAPTEWALFGFHLGLSRDGTTLAVGAFTETVVTDEGSADQAGCVYVFTRDTTQWTQRDRLTARHPYQGDLFGSAVALSEDGSIVAVGAFNEHSVATGIDGDDLARGLASGAAYVFARAGDAWRQQAYIKASERISGAEFGWSLALSADGALLAVGAPHVEDRDGTVSVFARDAGTWEQQARLAIGRSTNATVGLGMALALSADGSTLALSAELDSSAAAGIDGDESDESADRAGACYLFTHTGATWTRASYLKAPNPDAGDAFCGAVALSADGYTIASSARYEASATNRINGDWTDNSVDDAGAVYVYH